MSKYTPGPWKHDGHNGLGMITTGDESAVIASVRPALAREREERQANLDLMAASPELLQALKRLASEVEDEHLPEPGCELHGPLSTALDIALRAIAKAEGREK